MSFLDDLVNGGFESIFNGLNRQEIANKVDEIGLDSFNDRACSYSFGTGFASGLGGPLTIAAFPADVVNTIAQQLRITVAIVYDQTGQTDFDFWTYVKIIAFGLGAAVTSTVVGTQLLRKVVQILLPRMTLVQFSKVVPVLGGLFAGGVNAGALMLYANRMSNNDIAGFLRDIGLLD